MVKVIIDINRRITQGDIYKNVDYIQQIEYVDNQELIVHKILFPLVVVLTQDCDLQQDSAYYDKERTPSSNDKKLFSVIVAPLYNEDIFLQGQHLAHNSIGYQMRVFNKKRKGKLTSHYKSLIDNEIPRYHHMDFVGVNIVPSVIDFKHYFSVDIENLNKNRRAKYVCSVKELYREQITQRFANFLSRIGLPNPE